MELWREGPRLEDVGWWFRRRRPLLHCRWSSPRRWRSSAGCCARPDHSHHWCLRCPFLHGRTRCFPRPLQSPLSQNKSVKRKEFWYKRYVFLNLRGAAADLCPTLSGRSRRGSPGCPCGPSPRGAAAEPAASAGAAAPVLKSPAGADSSCPSLQVSEEGKEEALTVRRCLDCLRWHNTDTQSTSVTRIAESFLKGPVLIISIVLQRSSWGEPIMDHN